MINMIILVVFALIGLVVGYLAISIKLSKAKEQAETTLLKAEQDAVNLRSQAEHDADHLRVTAERESKAQRKELLLEAKENVQPALIVRMKIYQVKNSPSRKKSRVLLTNLNILMSVKRMWLSWRLRSKLNLNVLVK